MSACDQPLRCLEQLALLSERMLRCAQSGEWALLGPLEAQFSSLVEQHRRLPDSGARDPQGLQQSARLYATIEANHQAVQALVRPQLQRLASALRSMEWQQHLHNTYSRPGQALL